MLIRPAVEADAAPLAAIYGHHVLHGLGTFEEVPPTPQDMEARRLAVTAHGLPYLVAEEAGRVLGYAYANHFRPRKASCWRRGGCWARRASARSHRARSRAPRLHG